LNNTKLPRYLLLLGDGSYDYKEHGTNSITNFIPTYQSRKSQTPTESYVSDDYYGFLDDGEGFWGERAGSEGGVQNIIYWVEGDTAINTHGLDIAVSRIPVATSSEANAMIKKVTNYISSPAGFGPWRNKVVLVADHKDSDGTIHIGQADSYTTQIGSSNPCINIDKIYMDNYLRENTASGSRFPDGKSALLSALDKGSLVVNYTGHGGEVGWSNASILDISDINKLGNENRTPAYITATCEFGRWDDPGRRSGGEVLYLHPDGGAIAMFTTVRVVYSGPNFVLNQNFYKHVFTWDAVEDRWPTMGEVFMRTKNDSWLSGTNNRNFSLMGDPAMPLAYPNLEAVITKINGSVVQDTIPDSLGALSLVTIEGEIRTPQGQLVPTFNGELAATVYDKPSRFTTKRAPFSFLWQKNRVFNGIATITNGTFSFQFVVPIDVSYEDGMGKISLYASGSQIDGAGCNSNLFIGGASGTSIIDDRGPELDLFLNDLSFPDGGLVGPDPLMLAEVFDENGLNTVGTGIGHELTAVLDENESDVIVLNDFYTANSNSYKEGVIRYPFHELPEGEHTLTVKVWDVANNSNSAKVRFIVANDATFALGHVLNYPNPFSTNTKFFIEHNRNGRLLKVQVRVYTVAGNLVKTLEDTFFSEGNLYSNMEWDGLDDYGDVLGRGVYVYQVLVKDEETGDQVTQFEKLVLLR
ncbi:MAG TPA: type IX secretion system sortase PorU, partial [Bacteroidetes bacterium]|nr:type IX secretion system sortase PorU [Bacteroidota bacterium]